ncbi:hypothetical protein PG995_004593 [Apiospora arundinis]
MLRFERNATDSYTAHLRRILPIALPALISFATAGNFAAAGVLGVWSFELPSKLLILIPCVSNGLWALWQRSCIIVVNFEPRTLRNWFRALVALQVLCLVSWAAWSASWDLILLIVFLVHHLLALAAQRVASNDIDWAVFWLRLRRRVAASRTGQESIYSVEDATRYPRNAHTDAVATDKPGSHIHVDVVGPEKDRQAVLQRLTGKHSSQLWPDSVQRHYVPIPSSNGVLVIGGVNNDTWRTEPHLRVFMRETLPSEETQGNSQANTAPWRVEACVSKVVADDQDLIASRAECVDASHATSLRPERVWSATSADFQPPSLAQQPKGRWRRPAAPRRAGPRPLIMFSW